MKRKNRCHIPSIPFLVFWSQTKGALHLWMEPCIFPLENNLHCKGCKFNKKMRQIHHLWIQGQSEISKPPTQSDFHLYQFQNLFKKQANSMMRLVYNGINNSYSRKTRLTIGVEVNYARILIFHESCIGFWKEMSTA